jgi:hypothetical protein
LGEGTAGEAVGALVTWPSPSRVAGGSWPRSTRDNLASRHLLERLGFGVDLIIGAYVWCALERVRRP